MILAVDPGYEQSAYVRMAEPLDFGILPNSELLCSIYDWQCAVDTLVIEKIESFGMPVGVEIFRTVWWSGRFWEGWRGNAAEVTRREVKLHLCGHSRAKDANIRQALIDRYGPGKEKAIGKKKTPGPLYGVKADIWAALAVGVTYQEMMA